MKHFWILRIAENQDGTFGVFLEEDIPFCLTIERKWLNNEKGKSCIPVGDYLCERINSTKFGNTFEVKNVPNRTEILFHKGNIMEDSHGCIVVGEQFEPLDGDNAVLSSGKAFTEFKERTRDVDVFKLSIRDVSIYSGSIGP
jgi:hypothetical protein